MDPEALKQKELKRKQMEMEKQKRQQLEASKKRDSVLVMINFYNFIKTIGYCFNSCALQGFHMYFTVPRSV